jgi:hypothetical protein
MSACPVRELHPGFSRSDKCPGGRFRPRTRRWRNSASWAARPIKTIRAACFRASGGTCCTGILFAGGAGRMVWSDLTTHVRGIKRELLRPSSASAKGPRSMGSTRLRFLRPWLLPSCHQTRRTPDDKAPRRGPASLPAAWPKAAAIELEKLLPEVVRLPVEGSILRAAAEHIVHLFEDVPCELLGDQAVQPGAAGLAKRFP